MLTPIRSTNPHLGVPELARLLTDKYASVTAQVRHVSKLLDDTKKTYETVIAEFDAIAQEHHDRFTGNAVRWVGRFETDLGLYVAGGTLLGATWPAAYRLGLSVNAEGTISGRMSDRYASVTTGGMTALRDVLATAPAQFG